MPKLKKQPHNAYYYFMVDRKQKYEADGHRFLGGMKDVAEAVRDEWRELPLNERAFFEEKAKKAKEDEKYNLHNKFTVTGESYAQLREREEAEKKEYGMMEEYIDSLTITSCTPPERTNFIIIKAIPSCVQHHEERYWPLELAMGVFSLADGLKCNYSTLINTKVAPFGFASTVKETAEETALPVPGSAIFTERDSDYRKILINIKRFIEKFLDSYPRKFVLFTMESELKPAEGCLKWLYDNAQLEDTETPGFEFFFKNLKFYKLPKLILRFALIAKARNRSYNHVMVQYPELENAAIALLTEGCFDYRDDITCPYHRMEANSYKMNLCCRNVVLRRIYLLLNHMVPAMNLTMLDGHNIERFADKSASCRPLNKTTKDDPVAKMPKQEEFKDEKQDEALAAAWDSAKSQHAANPKTEPKDDYADNAASVGSGFTVGAARNPQIPFGLKRESEPASFDEDDFPTLGSTIRQTSSGWGRGRGTGVSVRRESNDDFPSSSFAVGRGRGFR